MNGPTTDAGVKLRRGSARSWPGRKQLTPGQLLRSVGYTPPASWRTSVIVKGVRGNLVGRRVRRVSLFQSRDGVMLIIG